MQYLTKEKIAAAAEAAFDAFTECCNGIDETSFFKQLEGKWSVAENVKHLVISTNISALPYRLPGFIVRFAAGKPNRPSRSYEELVEKYKGKLAAGGKASARFVPKPPDKNVTKQILMDQWKKSCSRFLSALKKTKSETKLDDYLVRHPLLGRITLRELGYFTIYHTEHHLDAVKKITAEKN